MCLIALAAAFGFALWVPRRGAYTETEVVPLPEAESRAAERSAA
jgi:hypothetical protein